MIQSEFIGTRANKILTYYNFWKLMEKQFSEIFVITSSDIILKYKMK